MLIGMKIKLLDKEDTAWDDYVDRSPNASIYHLSHWRHVIKNVFNHDAYYFYAINDEDEIVGVLPLIYLRSKIFGNSMISVPYFNYGGVIADNQAIKDKLISYTCEYLKKTSANHIEYRNLERIGNYPHRLDKVSMVLELPTVTEQLWKDIGSKLRAQIKRPQRENVSVKIGKEELIGDFYVVYSENMRDLGTPVYAREFFTEIFKTYPDYCNIVIVYKGDVPAASGFLISYKKYLEIPWASSLRKYNSIGVNMMLYWEVLKFAIETKHSLFDFGRCTVNSGTYRFKKQWGAKPIQLYWAYCLKDDKNVPFLSPNNPKYKLAISIWKKLPLIIANYLGPKLIKHLP